MHTILCMLLLWQTCAPRCMPCLIVLPYFTSPLRWQTCASLCMPRPMGLPCFISSLLWQTCAPIRVSQPFGLPCLTLLLCWLSFTPLTFSCCWHTPFLILARLRHCLCCSCSCIRHDTNPPWYKLIASFCGKGIRCNDDTVVWRFVRCKAQTWKQSMPKMRICCQ